jgi:hypothetical protein
MAKSMAGFLEKPTILFAMFVYLGINTLSNITTKLSFWRGGRQSEHSGLCSAAQRSLSHELRTSSSSHGIACSGDGDGGNEDSNSYSGGGGDNDYGFGGVDGDNGGGGGGGGGGDSDDGGHKQQTTNNNQLKAAAEDSAAAAATTAAGTMARDDDDCSGSGDGGGDGCGSLAEEGRGLQGWMCQVSSDGGRQKIAKAIWRFHPTARRHVFDAVLKHGWLSAPCHGATMAEKK